MRGKRRATGVLLAAGLLALGMLMPAVSDAAKRKGSDTLKVKTRTATASASADGQLVAATATCPKKTKVVGGGFSSEFIPTQAIFAVYESRRNGSKQWQVLGALDRDMNPPPISLTAYALCVKLKGKVIEASSSGPVPDNGLGDVTATCPGGKLISGGFSIPTPTLTLQQFGAPYRSIPGSAPRSWLTSFYGFDAAYIGTSFAYCTTAKGLRRPITSEGTGSLGSTAGSVGAIMAPGCTGKRRPIAGTFSAPTPVVGGNSVPLFYESQPAGTTSWQAKAFQVGSTGGLISAIAYCSKN